VELELDHCLGLCGALCWVELFFAWFGRSTR